MNKKPQLYYQTYKLTMHLYNLVRNFKREHKYNLGKSIIKISWQMVDGTIKANSLPNHLKDSKIKEISVSFDKLKLRLRMAHELKLISHKQYSRLIKQNEEIGKMLSGWLKWAQKQKE